MNPGKPEVRLGRGKTRVQERQRLVARAGQRQCTRASAGIAHGLPEIQTGFHREGNSPEKVATHPGIGAAPSVIGPVAARGRAGDRIVVE